MRCCSLKSRSERCDLWRHRGRDYPLGQELAQPKIDISDHRHAAGDSENRHRLAVPLRGALEVSESADGQAVDVGRIPAQLAGALPQRLSQPDRGSRRIELAECRLGHLEMGHLASEICGRPWARQEPGRPVGSPAQRPQGFPCRVGGIAGWIAVPWHPGQAIDLRCRVPAADR